MSKTKFVSYLLSVTVCNHEINDSYFVIFYVSLQVFRSFNTEMVSKKKKKGYWWVKKEKLTDMCKYFPDNIVFLDNIAFLTTFYCICDHI